MTGTELITRWTARIAMLLMAAGLGLMSSRTSGAPHRAARVVWTLGLGAFVLHVLVVFQLVYHWSHSAALLDTAEQTRRMTGVASGGGIYLNYLFLLVWAADVLVWWGWPNMWSRRRGVRGVVYAFMVFMAFNASIVFVHGAARWVGILVTALLVLFACSQRRTVRA